ncbi:MAG: YdcF family protein [Flavobacteriaceae bacterium]|nr:YdcF family protein [Flavobacteriaceae bacterium]
MKKHFKKLIYLSIFGLIVLFSVNFYVKSETDALIYTSENDVPKNNVGIVFGAGIIGDKPSKYLRDRLDAGILLYKSKKINKILLSGDNGSDAHDELTVMKKYCFENGVDTTKIYIDYAGFDTYSTIYRAKNIFKIDKAILVTQEYHLNRAIYIGNKLGIKSVGFSANVGEYRNYNYVCFREYFSIFKSAIDVARNRKPHFLGSEININGVSNYSKDDKR